MKKISLIAAVAAALLASPSLAQTAQAIDRPTIDRQAALDGMVAAEKAFSDDAVKKGIRDSFLDFLADDGVLFRPDPVNGKEFLRGRPATPGLLSWHAAYAEVSLAGDLGYDTGPAEYRGKAGDKPDQIQFATVWKRQANGAWKAVVDLGTSDNPPIPVAISLKGPAKMAASALPKVDAAAEKASLLLAERTLDKATRLQGLAASAPFLADDARLLRPGRPMISGKEAVRAFLSEDKKPLGWEPAGGGVALSGDLGYTYGVVQRPEGDAASPWVKTDNYLHVWRKGMDGAWKLVFEVVNPRPKPKPAPGKPS